MRKAVNPQATAGFAINLQGDSEEQLRQARLLAAKAGGCLPRGGNLGIGRLDTTDARENKKTASKGAADPHHCRQDRKTHTWQGLQPDRPAATPTAAATGSTKMVNANWNRAKIISYGNYRQHVAAGETCGTRCQRQSQIGCV